MPNHSKQPEGEAHSTGGMNTEEIENKKLHDELCGLNDKYEEMARKMEGSSSIDQLLNFTYLPYNTKVMAVSLPPKFKVPQIE